MTDVRADFLKKYKITNYKREKNKLRCIKKLYQMGLRY